MSDGPRWSAAIAVAVASLVLTACGSDGGTTNVAAGPVRRPVPAGPAASAWSQASGDAARSSATTATGPQRATVRWKKSFGGAAAPGAAVGIDGTVLVAANDGKLRALDPVTGKERWSFDGGGGYGSDLSTTPAVLADGTILWPAPGNRLVALGRDGAMTWATTFGSFVLSPAVVGGDRVYVSDQGGTVRALDFSGPTPTTAWSVELGGTSYSSPSVGPEGTVYAGTDRTLFAIADQGDQATIIWSFAAKDTIEVSTAVTPDGIVIVGTNSDAEYGISRGGKVRWAYPKGDWSYSSPVVRDGKAYFGDHEGYLNVVDAGDGQLITRFRGLAPGQVPGGVGPWTAPLVDAAGNVYFGTEAGHVYGYAADGRQLFDLDTGSVVAGYPALTADGTLVIGNQSGTVYALRS